MIASCCYADTVCEENQGGIRESEKGNSVDYSENSGDDLNYRCLDALVMRC